MIPIKPVKPPGAASAGMMEPSGSKQYKGLNHIDLMNQRMVHNDMLIKRENNND